MAQLFRLWNADYISWGEKSRHFTFFTGIYCIIAISIYFPIFLLWKYFYPIMNIHLYIYMYMNVYKIM